jgi:hypothetical protein
MDSAFRNDSGLLSAPRSTWIGKRRWPLGLVAISLSLLSLLSLAKQLTHLEAAAPLYSDVLHPVEVVANGEALCNSVAFSQLNSKPDLFVGRVENSTRCDDSLWTLGLFRMDWKRYRLELVRHLIELPTPVQSNQELVTAYDPHTVEFDDTTWVAFECGGNGIGLWATCVAPLHKETETIDATRLTVVVTSIDRSASGWLYSASDPKLLTFAGSLYLYWTVVKIRGAPPHFDTLSARGMRLEQEAGGLRRMWGEGSNGRPVTTNDPSHTTVVATPDPVDPSANSSIDIFDVRQFDNRIFALAGVGGSGCTLPLSANGGCYRMQILEAPVPLPAGGFLKKNLPDVDLPLNPSQYSRFVNRADGSLAILASYLDPVVREPGGYYFPKGLFLYGVSLARLGIRSQ